MQRFYFCTLNSFGWLHFILIGCQAGSIVYQHLLQQVSQTMSIVGLETQSLACLPVFLINEKYIYLVRPSVTWHSFRSSRENGNAMNEVINTCGSRSVSLKPADVSVAGFHHSQRIWSQRLLSVIFINILCCLIQHYTTW